MRIDSPFRYPGGKSWLVERMLKEITQQQRPARTYLEPFAGGASVGLAVASLRLADRVVLVEKDKNVAAVWRTALGRESEWLAREIVQFDFSKVNVETVLGSHPRSVRERAFRTLLKNRVSRGGLLTKRGGILNSGERGNGIGSRWYPITLANRIRKIRSLADRVSFIEGDGLEVLVDLAPQKSLVAFIDPPYTAHDNSAGNRLYDEYEIDHAELFNVCARLSGRFYMTYDDNIIIRKMIREYGYRCERIAMRSTHHQTRYELFVHRSVANA